MSKSNLPILIVGTGGLARSLSIAIQKSGLQIIGIISRGGAEATEFCRNNKLPLIPISQRISEKCICIIAVPDTVINSVLNKLQITNDSIILHTAGSVDKSVLAEYAENYGVFYPLQTFHPSTITDYSEVNVCLEANNEYTKTEIHKIAQLLTSHIYFLDSKQRLVLHLSAVFACNFSNLMYSVSYKLLAESGIDYTLLHSLIKETAEKATIHPPAEVQTGPAIRGDISTINNHLSLLAGKEKELYQILSDIIRLKQITLR
ncbi:MAG: DUF2520 domain-containing protein [Salinivirgaceae bacterium]|nr:DUF2520 domain-containing protein [Salinivirgaceae bacterium]MDD4747203.1 DUF2520 domain-containing protein [Salinivirgaceae bacterium]MDY0279433.1 DUF2520 domain-containing protein [Salinivirgaceae bacterium]